MPTWALAKLKRDQDADAWAAPHMAELGDEWERIADLDFATKMAQSGFQPDGQPLPTTDTLDLHAQGFAARPDVVQTSISPIAPKALGGEWNEGVVQEDNPPDIISPEVPMPGFNLGLRAGGVAQMPLPPQLSKPTESEEQEERVRRGRAPIESADQAFGPYIGPAAREGAAVLSGEKPLSLGGAAQIAAGVLPVGEFAQPLMRQSEASPGTFGDAVLSPATAERGVRAADDVLDLARTAVKPSFGADTIAQGIKSVARREPDAAMGAVVGLEEDEEGNISVSPEKAAIGVVAANAMGRIKPNISADPVVRRLQESALRPPERMVTRRTMGEWLRTKLSDRRAPLANLQDEYQEVVRRAGGKLSPDEQVYFQARVNPNIIAEQRIAEGYRPIVREVEAAGDRAYLTAYLEAADNVDVAASIGNPNRKFSGNLTAAESQYALQQIPQEVGPDRAKRIQDAAQGIWDFNRSLLQRKLDAGIITNQLFTDLTTKYPRYVPTRILDYLRDNEANMGVGRALSLKDTGLRSLTEAGTEGPREDALASILRLAYESESKAQQNITANAVFKVLDGLGLVGQGQPVRKVGNNHTPKRDEELMHVFKHGVKETYALPTYMRDALKSDATTMLPGLAPAMSIFRLLATGRNPVFLAKNALLDIPGYFITTLAKEGGNPLRIPSMMADLAKGYVAAFDGMTAGEWRGAPAQARRLGAGFGGWADRSEVSMRQSLEDTARGPALEIRHMSDLRRLVSVLTPKGHDLTAPLKPIGALSERIEAGPRTAAFNRAKKRGLSDLEAMIDYNEATIDFDMGGTLTKYVNGLVPFFNVGAQAVLSGPRLLKNHPKGALLTAGSLLVAPTLMAEALNNSDPQTAQDYADVPQWVKDQGIVLMLSGIVPPQFREQMRDALAPVDELGERHPQYHIFHTRQYTPVVIAVREATNKVMGKPDNRGGLEMIASMFHSTSPVQGLSSLVPPGLSTAMELKEDTNFYTGQRIGTRFNDEKASPLSRGIATGINEVASNAGMYPDVRPSQVEYATRDTMTGLAAAAHGAASLIGGQKRQSGLPQDIPGIGGVVSAVGGARTGGRLDEARKDRLSPEHQKMLYEAGLKPDVTAVATEIDGSPLTRQEAATYQLRVNAYVHEALNDILYMPDFKSASLAERVKMVQDGVAQAREQARDEMRGDIGSDVLDDRSERRTTRRETVGVR